VALEETQHLYVFEVEERMAGRERILPFSCPDGKTTR